MSWLDIEGKDGVLKVEINFKAHPRVEEAVATFLFALAAALKRFNAHIEIEPEK
jgi:hypothetical protein